MQGETHIHSSPLQRATFRQLGVGMSMSYAGDRLQQLAQAWLAATLTNSALAVGGITAWPHCLGGRRLVLGLLSGRVAVVTPHLAG